MDKVRVNNQIYAKSVRLIDEDGALLGVVNLEDAIQKAKSLDLDLIEIAPNASPPVCKILDYGKYKYLLQKKEAKKKQKHTDTKELKIRPTIADGDFAVKLRSAKRFLEHGHRVRISLIFKGREISYNDIGFEVINKFYAELEDCCKLEMKPKMEGRQIFMILAPR